MTKTSLKRRAFITACLSCFFAYASPLSHASADLASTDLGSNQFAENSPEKTPVNQALDWANGYWELVPDKEDRLKGSETSFQCGVDPLVITIEKSGKIYSSKFVSEKAARKAEISQSTPSALTIKYENETRQMTSGQPHIWHMVFTSPDEFVWVRDDWIQEGKVTGSTQPRRRCVTNMV